MIHGEPHGEVEHEYQANENQHARPGELLFRIFTNVKRAIPNSLTLLNLLSGSFGIYLVFNDRPGLALIAALICLAADMLDGMTARLLGVSSDLGVQLDSLADIVSFGLAPGIFGAQ